MNKLLLIDGNSLLFRAFFALPPLENSKGQHTNAVFGFLNMFTKVLEEYNPTHCVVAFDFSRKTFRNELFADYKGTRKETPMELREQFAYAKDILSELGITYIEKQGIEADDIIGTLAKKCDFETVILTGDKDSLQLIDDTTTVWLTKKGITEIHKVDEKTLLSDFELKPYQVIELKALYGDTSDNIPGVKGIGEKGAMNLIHDFDTVENLYSNLESTLLSDRLRKTLTEQKDIAFLSKTLATIKTDCEIETNFDKFKIKLPFPEKFRQTLREFEFVSLLKKPIFGGKDIKKIEFVPHTQIEINSIKELEKYLKEDIKTFSFYIANDLYFSFNNKDFIVRNEYSLFNLDFNFEEYFEKLKPLIQNPNIEKIVFNFKETLQELEKHNITSIENFFDIELASYITAEKILKPEEIGKYETLKYELINEINDLDLNTLYNDIEMPLEKVLFDMEKNGFKVDREELKTLSQKYDGVLNEISKQIYQIAGIEFNINSPKQLADILFNKLRLPDTENKNHSTDIDALLLIKNQSPIIDLVIKYRKIAKLINTYIEAFQKYAKQNGDIIHTKFNQFLTATGRLSSSEPNLQNIPVKSEEGKEIRKIFISRFENGQIISADYNQIELRLLAHFSKDKTLVDAFKQNKDIHTSTASQIFGIPEDKVTPEIRRNAKAVNFGVIYGISGFGLAQNTGLSRAEAKEYIDKYFETFVDVKKYMDNLINFARKNGYAKTLFNRIRKIPEIYSNNFQTRQFGERVAMNMPLQGSASDIIKLAMIKTFSKLKEKNLQSKLILQIHDELIIDTHPNEIEEVKNILKSSMENIVSLEVPLIVEIDCGKSWYEVWFKKYRQMTWQINVKYV